MREVDIERIKEAMEMHGLALQELLKSDCDPYCTIIITPDGVKFVRDEMYLPAHREGD